MMFRVNIFWVNILRLPVIWRSHRHRVRQYTTLVILAGLLVLPACTPQEEAVVPTLASLPTSDVTPDTQATPVADASGGQDTSGTESETDPTPTLTLTSTQTPTQTPTLTLTTTETASQTPVDDVTQPVATDDETIGSAGQPGGETRVGNETLWFVSAPEGAALYDQPSLESDVVAQAEFNRPLLVVATRDGWHRVTLGGETVYVQVDKTARSQDDDGVVAGPEETGNTLPTSDQPQFNPPPNNSAGGNTGGGQTGGGIATSTPTQTNVPPPTSTRLGPPTPTSGPPQLATVVINTPDLRFMTQETPTPTISRTPDSGLPPDDGQKPPGVP